MQNVLPGLSRNVADPSGHCTGWVHAELPVVNGCIHHEADQRHTTTASTEASEINRYATAEEAKQKFIQWQQCIGLSSDHNMCGIESAGPDEARMLTCTNQQDEKPTQSLADTCEEDSPLELLASQFMNVMRRQAAVLWDHTKQHCVRSSLCSCPAQPLSTSVLPKNISINNPLPRTSSARTAHQPRAAPAGVVQGVGKRPIRSGKSSSLKTSMSNGFSDHATAAPGATPLRLSGGGMLHNAVTDHAGHGSTTRGTDGKPGTTYSLKETQLPNGSVVTGQTINRLSMSQAGIDKLQGMLQEGFRPQAEHGQRKDLWMLSKRAVLARVRAQKEAKYQVQADAKKPNHSAKVKRRSFALAQKNDVWNPRITAFVQDPSCTNLTRPQAAVDLLTVAMPPDLATQAALSVRQLADLTHPMHLLLEHEHAEVAELHNDSHFVHVPQATECVSNADTCQTDTVAAGMKVLHNHGDSIRLTRPDDIYDRPCIGQHAPRLGAQRASRHTRVQQKMGTLTGAASSCRKLHAAAQRPTTIMNASTSDVLPLYPYGRDLIVQQEMVVCDEMSASKQYFTKPARAEDLAADCEAEMLKNLLTRVAVEQPLSVKVANSSQQKQIQFRFHSKVFSTSGNQDKVLIISEHHDGAKYCEDLFGHFVLPNGRLAHFFYHAADSLHGHRVCSLQPPTGPRTWKGSMQRGLPATPDVYHRMVTCPTVLGICRAHMWVPYTQLPELPEVVAIEMETLREDAAHTKRVRVGQTWSHEYDMCRMCVVQTPISFTIGAIDETRPR
eukprot:jgi/Ulvmu1/2736/UM014_0193.1